MNSRPTILIVLGVTGDLAAKKILPAVYNLHKKQALPEQFHLVGFGRKPYTSETFQPYIQEVVRKRLPDADDASLEKFLFDCSYVQGNFDDKDSYQNLASYLQVLENRFGENADYLFYLSVPPDIYEPILNNISASPLLYRGKKSEAETRILVEKPIGNNLASATYLEQLLGEHFREQEIYRIDHYLAKEMVQNILTFRFANDMFERSWDRESITKIEIRLWETLGVENRGSFYDSLGALRDVGQNHLLQMLALLTMNEPIDFKSANLHAKRSEVLYKLKPLAVEEIPKHTFRAQYHGYRDIAGVVPESNRETYFKIRSYLDDPRWQGVPITIESGKRMHEQRKEVIVHTRHNKVTFALEPTEGITIEFISKKPGLDTKELETRTIDFMLRDQNRGPQYIEEYEKLLLDSILGDQTLFVSTAEVKAMWRFVDPIIVAWEQNLVPLNGYQPDTDEAIVHSLILDSPS